MIVLMDMMTILIAGSFGLLGACLGSFAGATAWRLEKGRDFVRDRSECEHCHHKLAWYDLLPLVSWLMLAGKCRYCQRPIGLSALLVEVGLAAYFVLSYVFWPLTLDSTINLVDFGLWLAIGVPLAIIFVYDFRWKLMPQSVLTVLIALGVVDFALRIVQSGWGWQRTLVELGLALLAVAGFYGLLYVLSKKAWVGFGDIELGAFMGLVLAWPAALLAVFIANLVGTLVVLPGLLLGRIGRQSRVAFGPLLIIGFFVSGLWGQVIIDWYLAIAIG